LGGFRRGRRDLAGGDGVELREGVGEGVVADVLAVDEEVLEVRLVE
jgi:hypothetical protein